MDIKKDLCCKGQFSSFCLLCIMVLALIISPGPMGRSCAEVIIDDPRTPGVDLDDEPRSGDNGAKAAITSTGSVTSSGAYAVRCGSTGWNVNIEAGGSVENTAKGSGNNAILFNARQDGSGTALTGSVTNSGTITSAGTGIRMGGGGRREVQLVGERRIDSLKKGFLSAAAGRHLRWLAGLGSFRRRQARRLPGCRRRPGNGGGRHLRGGRS